jgi:hypothetical protein
VKNLSHLIEKHYHSWLIFIALNGLAITFFAMACVYLGIQLDMDTFLASTDAKGYWAVSNFFSQAGEVSHLATRPFFYPLFLGVFNAIGGILLIWIVQIALWLGTINFVFLSIKRFSNSIPLGLIGAGLVVVNLSFIALTFHGLTEVISTFFICCLLYVIIHFSKSYRSPKFILACLAVISILTVIKPVFFIPWLVIVFVPLPLFYLKSVLGNKKNLIRLLLVLSPVICQIGIMKVNYNTFQVSKIGDLTLKNYFFAQGIKEVEGVDRKQAISRANEFSSEEMNAYMKEHIDLYRELFQRNLNANFIGKSTFVCHFPAYLAGNNVRPCLFMEDLNAFYLKWHLRMMYLFPVFLIYFGIRKRWDVVLPIFFIGGFLLYYIVVSGISFDQGDRLILPTIGMFSVLYLSILWFVGSELYIVVKKKVT